MFPLLVDTCCCSSSSRFFPTTMFAARVRSFLKPLFHRRHCEEIAAISKRILLDRFNDRDRILNRAFHTSPQCYTSESDVGVKAHTPALFGSFEDDFLSELGSVQKQENPITVLKVLTMKQEPQISQKTNGKKMKKKKHEQDSDSFSKLKLLTEKPEVSWKTNGKRKTEARSSSPARNVTDSNVKPSKSSSPTPDHNSKAQNIISPSLEEKNQTSSKGSPTSNTLSDHPSSVVVIRISNLNSKTADSVIHSMCLFIGPLEGLARVNEDTVDVLFRARNLNEADFILEELNAATVDQSQWTAEIVPEAEEASRDKMGVRITSYFEDLEKQVTMRRILAKDLELLLHSVMHLENHPMTHLD